MIQGFVQFDAEANELTTLEKPKMKLFTRGFWSYTTERVIKTTAQSALALLSASGAGVLDVDWVNILSVTGMMALLSFLTALSSYSSPVSTEKK